MSVVGIDFGALHSKIGVARHRGIDIIINEVSNRATPSLVSFGHKARAIGESAKTLEISNFRNTVGSLKRLLGRTIDDPEIKEVEEKFTHVKLVDANGTVGAQGLFAALELFLRDLICTLNRAVLKLMKVAAPNANWSGFPLCKGSISDEM
ncbi:hypothetical protein NUW54_g3214 [Trametes sanguinea]|uniref:Uncharacterized protein n=1 Tax=Trametes sanguinea TaxID=158606 RepID=A0ACC1Q2K3_9APHY|nr:hypothetical protein NUW54_g3214 [Trametes sanguinea]